ncbi:hypothetical protein KQI52_14225 [bacterium]|nr:hypothetical protein [bacterium]
MRTLTVVLIVLTATVAAHAGDTWRALVNDQIKHARTVMRTDTVTVLTINIMLEKDGEEKERDTTRTRVYFEGGDQVIDQIAPDGEITDTKREPRPEGYVPQSGVLSMFDIENADVFTLTEQGHDEDGFLIVEFTPNEPADSLFTGTAYIDTSAWFPARMEMTLSELPSKVKEMEMVAHFGPGADGVFRPQSMTADGRAKWLLLNFYFRTETEYSW